VYADRGKEGGRFSHATTVTDCRQACIDNDLCTGFDLRLVGQSGISYHYLKRVECYLHGPWSAGNRYGYLGGSTFYNYTCRGKQRRIKKMNLEGANSGGPPAGTRSGPPEADDFSQLKGYLDVTSGIMGGMAPLAPLKSASEGKLNSLI